MRNVLSVGTFNGYGMYLGEFDHFVGGANNMVVCMDCTFCEMERLERNYDDENMRMH